MRKLVLMMPLILATCAGKKSTDNKDTRSGEIPPIEHGRGSLEVKTTEVDGGWVVSFINGEDVKSITLRHGEKGPKGDKGRDGDRGPGGSRGPRGPAGDIGNVDLDGFVKDKTISVCYHNIDHTYSTKRIKISEMYKHVGYAGQEHFWGRECPEENWCNCDLCNKAFRSSRPDLVQGKHVPPGFVVHYTGKRPHWLLKWKEPWLDEEQREDLRKWAD